MFGVFSTYELQVLHDWIRGSASADGQPFTEAPGSRRATFRAQARHATRLDAGDPGLDPDVQVLRAALANLGDAERTAMLLQAMSPAQHWTPAGLEATRVFWAALTR